MQRKREWGDMGAFGGKPVGSWRWLLRDKTWFPAGMSFVSSLPLPSLPFRPQHTLLPPRTATPNRENIPRSLSLCLGPSSRLGFSVQGRGPGGSSDTRRPREEKLGCAGGWTRAHGGLQKWNTKADVKRNQTGALDGKLEPHVSAPPLNKPWAGLGQVMSHPGHTFKKAFPLKVI